MMAIRDCVDQWVQKSSSSLPIHGDDIVLVYITADSTVDKNYRQVGSDKMQLYRITSTSQGR